MAAGTGQKCAVNTRKSKEITADKDADSNTPGSLKRCEDENDLQRGKIPRAATRKTRPTRTKQTRNTGSSRTATRSKLRTRKNTRDEHNKQGSTSRQLEAIEKQKQNSNSNALNVSAGFSSISTWAVESVSVPGNRAVADSSTTSRISSLSYSESEQSPTPRQEKNETEIEATGSRTMSKATACTTTKASENVVAGTMTPDIMQLFQKDADGDTILHLAVAQGNQTLTQWLIQAMRQQTLDVYNNMRQTPLHLAVITQQAAVVKWLTDSGADVNLMDRNGQTSLHLACKNADVACVKAICEAVGGEKSRIKLDLRNFQGLAAVHIAALSGHREVIKLVLSLGANINAQDTNSGRTALHHAVESGRHHVVEYLMSRGARVNAQTFAGNTALHTATGREMDEMVKLLVTNGADVNIPNLEGDVPRVVRSSEMAKRQFQSSGGRGKKTKR